MTLACGCKAARWREHDESKNSEAAATGPQKIASVGTTVSAAGPAFDMDERTGRAKGRLILRLDYFPEARPGGTNLPVCYDAYEPNFELGSAMCDGKPETKVALTAGMLNQECYTHPEVAKVPASQTLVLLGCKRGMILALAFTPPLKIDVETKEVGVDTTVPTPLP